MKKIKQLANNAFVRPDRTEVLSESLQEAERRIEQIKLTCETLSKKVSECLQVKGKEHVGIDKRIRKVPEYLLGTAMIANGKSLYEGSILGEVLSESGQIEIKLGQAAVEYEVKIEECILRPLTTLMENDLPSIYKLKRALAKSTGDMDTAKNKLTAASRHSMSAGQGAKVDNIKDELDEALVKVEQCRDNLAAEMYSLISKECEISKLVVDFLNFQKEYHYSVFKILSELISGVDNVLSASNNKPVYGHELEDHLKSSQRTIAYPIELCVCALLVSAIEEEGLFRMAGSMGKVRKLKSAFDAGLVDLESLISEFCDAHVIANALKCYLRELPEPLLTFNLYNEWINAVRIPDSAQKLEALWFVMKKLPPANYENFRYLVKFLKELSDHQDVNKMSPANIAIVIAPNLLWSKSNSGDDLTPGGDTSQMGLNMTMTHLYSSVLDQVVSNCSYFFPDDVEFFITFAKPAAVTPVSEPQPQLTNGTVSAQSTIDESSSSEELSKTKTHRRNASNSSVEEGASVSPSHSGSPKPIRRHKNKPAPTPPVGQNKNPLANANANASRPFSGIPYANASANSPASKEKREGVWIPPSPKETKKRELPVKPPPPNLSSLDAKTKFFNEPSSTSSNSPLRHKSSFKSSASVEKTANNTTDTLDFAYNSSSKGSNSNFASLPRHFHTENSHKAGRAPRPPSMFGVAPPAPPVVPVMTTSGGEKPKEVDATDVSVVVPAPSIGFERLENEVRKESLSGEEDISREEKERPLVRPIPAPRSSLLGQSHSFKGTTGNSGELPTVRERPSISAKPRDLSKRNPSASSTKEQDNQSEEQLGTNVNASQGRSSHDSGSSVEEMDKELPKYNCVGKSAQELPSPTTGPTPNRPPRPMPPAPPKSLKESTDL